MSDDPKTCKMPIARKMFLGVQVVIVLIFIGFAIAAMVIFLEIGGKTEDIEKYKIAGIAFGSLVGILYLIFQVVSKMEGKYKDKIRSQKINEIHYMLARTAYKDPDLSNEETKKFNEVYMSTLCEQNFNSSTDVRVNLLNKIFNKNALNNL